MLCLRNDLLLQPSQVNHLDRYDELDGS
uniref:Uncharacterized protein n=1 Tax=Moniliophthora roreri TaxID=221103 RepID=A0A0W0FZF1_MONRR